MYTFPSWWYVHPENIIMISNTLERRFVIRWTLLNDSMKLDSKVLRLFNKYTELCSSWCWWTKWLPQLSWSHVIRLIRVCNKTRNVWYFNMWCTSELKDRKSLLREWLRLRQWSIVFLLMNVRYKIFRRLILVNRTSCLLRNLEFALTGSALTCKFVPVKSKSHEDDSLERKRKFIKVDISWRHISIHLIMDTNCTDQCCEKYSRAHMTFIHILIHSPNR